MTHTLTDWWPLSIVLVAVWLAVFGVELVANYLYDRADARRLPPYRMGEPLSRGRQVRRTAADLSALADGDESNEEEAA